MKILTVSGMIFYLLNEMMVYINSDSSLAFRTGDDLPWLRGIRHQESNGGEDLETI